MKDSINIRWIGEMAFETEVNKHKIILDASPEVGGKDMGPRPKPLMMVALAGCTGMDVVSILKKMRVNIDGFNVRVDGELTDQHPKHFISMHIIYEFKGKDLPMDKIKKAIEMSQETYCGVSASYRKAMQLSYEIKVLD
jgi:putative redox protein